MSERDADRMADLILQIGTEEIPAGCSPGQRELLLSFARTVSLRIRLSIAEEAFSVRPALTPALTPARPDGERICRGDADGGDARAAIVNSMAALAIRSGADVDAVGCWMAGARDPHDGLSDLAALVRAGRAPGAREEGGR